MGQHEVEATFSAIDQMSNVASSIGNTIATMGGVVGQTMVGMGGDFEETGTALMALATGPIGVLQFALGTFVSHIGEVDGAMDSMTARLGLSDESMARLKTTAEDVFKTGLVGSFQSAADAAEAAARFMDRMSKEDFSELTRRVAGVAEAFGDSPKGVVRAVDTLISKFGDLDGDPIKALDLVVATAQKAERPLKEIEGIIERYSGKFASSGLSAMGMSGLIVVAAQAGIGPAGMGGLSVAIDTFHDRVAKPPWAFTNALRKLGLGDVVADLKANKISMDEALDKVFLAFSKLPEGPEKTATALALFGPGIEKIGGPETLGKLAGFKDALGGPNGIQGAAQKVADTMQDDGTLGAAFKQFWATTKTSVENGVDTIYNSLAKADWGGAIKSVTDGVTKIVSDGWNGLKKIVGDAITATRKGIEDGWNAILKFVNGVVDAVGKAFKAVADAITGVLKPVVDLLNSIIEKISFIAGQAGKGAIGDPTMPDISHPGRAAGGPLDEGWTEVGEKGPELAYKRGSNVDIFSNRESRAIMGSGGGSSGGSGATANFNGTYYIVGMGGMQEFIGMVRVGLEGEDIRLGRAG